MLSREEDFRGEKTVEQSRKAVETEKSDLERNDNRNFPLGKDIAFKERNEIMLDEQTLTKRRTVLAKIVNEVEDLTLKV
jgi:hypothetical protein